MYRILQQLRKYQVCAKMDQVRTCLQQSMVYQAYRLYACLHAVNLWSRMLCSRPMSIVSLAHLCAGQSCYYQSILMHTCIDV